MTRLDEFDRIEWFDLARQARPGLTQAEFDRLWEGFKKHMAKRHAN